MTTSPSPLVQRRRLRGELKRARLEAGLTQESVAREMDWSLSKIVRIERGSVGISRNDLTALLHLYEINDPQRIAHLVALGKVTRRQSWYSQYRELVTPIYFEYIEYETSAVAVRTYESLIIPGLLQTEEYATKVMRLSWMHLEPEAVRARVEIRLKRQQFLMGRENPLSLFFVLDEAVIRRLLRDKETRQGQLDLLISTAKRPGVTIEIVPFSAGLYSGMGEDFTLLGFSDPSDGDDVLYFEGARDAIFSEGETGDDTQEIEIIGIYRQLFNDIRNISLDPGVSLEFLMTTAKSLA